MKKEDKKVLRQTLVCDWLNDNYLQFNSLRYDELRDRLQVKCLPNPPSLGGDGVWCDLTDKDLNSMVCQCVNDVQANISVTEMWTALKSDMVPTVHPLRVWLEALRPYTPDQPDWIDMVAQQVHVKNNNVECGINKDNLNNSSASPTMLSGMGGHIYQQYQQLEINNENNYSQASANVGRGGVPEKSADFWGALQKLFMLSSYPIPHSLRALMPSAWLSLSRCMVARLCLYS